ncbi:hypothetical protein C8R44DRAFT_891982 [Mycena epipterygia]|nr:hypothetical protein C8R44DRAFT_891982 [Mycena epipterygia]
MSNVACPLTLKLGPEVEYQLISKVILIGDSDSVGHYVTKTRLKNATYLYNDLQRRGSLTELGPLHILEDFDPNTTFVLYLRASKACIEADFAKIPPPSKEITPVADSNSEEDVDQMLIDTITSPAKRTCPHPASSPPLEGSEDGFFTPAETPQPPPTEHLDHSGVTAEISFADTNSNTPCPLLCGGCGTFNPDGGDDPNEVQFDTNQIVMLPDPDVPDWKFRWLECTDGVLYHSEDSALTVQMLQTCWRNRQFCNEICNIKLAAQQIGNIRLPFYMKPDSPAHTNPALAKIFREALPVIAKILADFDQSHPTVASFNKFFAGKKEIEHHRSAGRWMDTLGLVPTPELEAVVPPYCTHC